VLAKIDLHRDLAALFVGHILDSSHGMTSGAALLLQTLRRSGYKVKTDLLAETVIKSIRERYGINV
jgi:hypothetical protein